VLGAVCLATVGANPVVLGCSSECFALFGVFECRLPPGRLRDPCRSWSRTSGRAKAFSMHIFRGLRRHRGDRLFSMLILQQWLGWQGAFPCRVGDGLGCRACTLAAAAGRCSSRRESQSGRQANGRRDDQGRMVRCCCRRPILLNLLFFVMITFATTGRARTIRSSPSAKPSARPAHRRETSALTVNLLLQRRRGAGRRTSCRAGDQGTRGSRRFSYRRPSPSRGVAIRRRGFRPRLSVSS